MTIDVAQLAWMAGIIDYKGRINYKANKTRANNKQVTLWVESVQKPIIDRLAALTGTKPELKTARQRWEGWYRKGCDEHCPDQHIHVAGTDFASAARWTLSGAPMAVVLTALKPYLIQDKGFSEAVDYAFGNMVLFGQGAGQTVASLRRLHALGWELGENVFGQRPNLVAGVELEMELVT
jgi:hypothetical protein